MEVVEREVGEGDGVGVLPPPPASGVAPPPPAEEKTVACTLALLGFTIPLVARATSNACVASSSSCPQSSGPSLTPHSAAFTASSSSIDADPCKRDEPGTWER